MEKVTQCYYDGGWHRLDILISQISNPIFTLITLGLIIVTVYLTERRSKEERIAYSRTEKWALFNIVTLGLVICAFILLLLIGLAQEGYIQDIGEYWTMTLVGTVMFMPIAIFLLINTFGKKDEELA